MRTKVKLLLPAATGALLLSAACAPPPVGSPAPPATGAGATTAPTTTPAPPPTTLPPIFTGPAELYAARPIDTWGQNGIAYVVRIVGDTVYVGGDFSTAVNHSQSAPRANLMAVDINTGALRTAFVADTDDIVYAVATDGTSLYVGGDFTTINGSPHQGLAKVDLATGAVDPRFNARTPGSVRDLLVAHNKLYLAGDFGSVDGVNRGSAAAVDLTTGALDPDFDPKVDGQVNAMAINRDGTKLYLGGQFHHVGATTRDYLAEVDPDQGSAQGPVFAGITDKVRDVTVKDDGTQVFAGAGGKFNSGLSWDPVTGKQQWRVRVDGDTQAIVYSRGYVYIGFHDGYQDDPRIRLLALDPKSGTVDVSFMPLSGGYPGVLSLDADGQHLVAGGLFPTMGDVAAHGVSIHPA